MSRQRQPTILPSRERYHVLLNLCHYAALPSAVRGAARVCEGTRRAMRSVPMALKRLILLAFVILVILPGNPPLPSSVTIISKRLEKRKGVNKKIRRCVIWHQWGRTPWTHKV